MTPADPAQVAQTEKPGTSTFNLEHVPQGRLPRSCQDDQGPAWSGREGEANSHHSVLQGAVFPIPDGALTRSRQAEMIIMGRDTTFAGHRPTDDPPLGF